MASMSQSTTHDPLGRPLVEIGFQVTLAILVCLVSTLGNVLVVYVINKDSRLKSITNIFIHNLALTDISMATLHMPFWVVSTYTGTWIFSKKWCEVSASIQFTLGMASILNMGLIALNRYIRVVKPALYSKLFASKRTAWFYCFLVWLVSILLATPPLYGWGEMAYHAKFSVCTFGWKLKHISYAILIVGGLVNGVTIAIFYSYYKIYKTVKASTQNVNAHGAENGVGTSNSRRPDMKLLKTSFTVVCVFVMTWGPVSIVVIVETAGCFIPWEVYTVVIYLMFSSSLVNPIIYGIMNPQFKLAFKKALSCGRHGNENPNQSCTGHGRRTTDERPGEMEVEH
ncbi:hypothetical protein OS493_008634 [Desmophyllum pertusum]|uniref:G-protein coupled receptors family 1 profile domain-containing protein n=1 Tax=Desmophyllum pertusum TaxID=174260 RepID=A0A9W9ZS39_9CNID|nr:hypothetical protein OS493_008634 [Desmophyllum pertusum]